MRRTASYLSSHMLLPISLALMAAGFIITPPTGEMIVSLRWDGIAMIAVTTLAVAGLRKENALAPLVKASDAFIHTGSLIAFLTAVSFLLSAFISSLAAIMLFLPSAVSVLRDREREDLIPKAAAIMAVAASSGGLLLPSGSLQNMLLSGTLGEGGSFMLLMMPYAAASLPLIAIILVLLLGRRTGERIYVERSADAGEEGPLGMKMLYICYAFISILASFGFFSWFDVLVLFLAISLAFDRSVFIRADYSLLLSSIFLSAAGASASPLIARILGDGAFWKAVLLSEITGSLPAAAAASGHLGAAELIEAVNIGAFGTLVQLPAVAAFRIVGKNGRKEFALLYTISSAILLIVFITMHIAAS